MHIRKENVGLIFHEYYLMNRHRPRARCGISGRRWMHGHVDNCGHLEKEEKNCS